MEVNRVKLYKSLRNVRLKDLQKSQGDKFVLTTDVNTYEIVAKNIADNVKHEIKNAEELAEIASAFPDETEEPETDDNYYYYPPATADEIHDSELI